MSFDGIVTRSVVSELNSKLVGGRVDKIYQQEKDELLLQVYSKGKNYRLLMSASSNNPRLYLTESSKSNPLSPPMFCMLLRKHLSGSIILDISQHHLDRVVIFTITGKDELGNPTERELIVEIMGKHSNIILINKESRRIIDSIKRVPAEISRVRQILPGYSYSYIESENKKDPLNFNRDIFYDQLEKSNGSQKIYKFLYQNFTGLSPLAGREICSISELEPDRVVLSLLNDEKERLFKGMHDFMTNVKNQEFKPVYILGDDSHEVVAFYALPLTQYTGLEQVYTDSVSQMLDFVYKSKDTNDRVRQKSASLRKILGNKLERAQNKLSKQKEELLNSRDREKFKIYADLLQSNLHRIQRGSDHVVLENFYDENLNELKVPLDPKISPAENAQRYYKKYGKLKTANQLLMEQIPETEAEISYIEHVLVSLDNATDVTELGEIKDELIIEGYIQRRSMKNKNKRGKLTGPLRFFSSDGFEILVGRNNRQNEILTMKTAKKEDIWLHTKGIPGSHVIIKTEGKHVPDRTLHEAGTLAAFYSKGRNSGSVEVDYTMKKYVRKPKDGKTGLVVYENQKTIVASPSPAIVDLLKMDTEGN
ncbi:Rqc2 family fibronectin-binding protein [Gudongella sp. SC589]|jgi:predicted ribosome quality control (RQC) complex YloA/Tae2 family protein|uniref:Rqc2 family fibronectin-binding protein n=1 Tax=Gudongella sp. SC589 TaxID=3385990 RepID=UPI003904775B